MDKETDDQEICIEVGFQLARSRQGVQLGPLQGRMATADTAEAQARMAQLLTQQRAAASRPPAQPRDAARARLPARLRSATAGRSVQLSRGAPAPLLLLPALHTHSRRPPPGSLNPLTPTTHTQVDYRWAGDANIFLAIELPAGGQATRMVPKVSNLAVRCETR